MRIVAGFLKGRRIQSPKGWKIRPASDRVRESLFAVLGSRVRQARVLDLFCGTGILGIEALSRGASHVTFVDRDEQASRLVEKNLQAVGLADRAVVRTADVASFLEEEEFNKPFEIVFIDPPFDSGLAGETLALIAPKKVLAPDGTAVVRHSSRENLSREAGGLRLTDERRYGDNVVCFYKANG